MYFSNDFSNDFLCSILVGTTKEEVFYKNPVVSKFLHVVMLQSYLFFCCTGIDD